MKLIKEIKSKQNILHFRRWRIFSSKYFNIFIHGIYKEDNDSHLHNHPWNLLTIVLYGSYIEELENEVLYKRTFLNFGYRNRNKYHKINTLLSKKVYTLAFTFGERNDDWGYNVNNEHIIFNQYRESL